jgi:hypothetical protein
MTPVDLAIGLGPAGLAGLVVRSVLYEVSALGPVTSYAAPLLLALATSFAYHVPARRAMKVAPAECSRDLHHG